MSLILIITHVGVLQCDANIDISLVKRRDHDGRRLTGCTAEMYYMVQSKKPRIASIDPLFIRPRPRACFDRQASKLNHY
jgi:hypothetical protein